MNNPAIDHNTEEIYNHRELDYKWKIKNGEELANHYQSICSEQISESKYFILSSIDDKNIKKINVDDLRRICISEIVKKNIGQNGYAINQYNYEMFSKEWKEEIIKFLIGTNMLRIVEVEDTGTFELVEDKKHYYLVVESFIEDILTIIDDDLYPAKVKKAISSWIRNKRGSNKELLLEVTFSNLIDLYQIIKENHPVSLYICEERHILKNLLPAIVICNLLYKENRLKFRKPFMEIMVSGYILRRNGNMILPAREYLMDYGHDCLCMYLLFLAPYTKDVYWDEDGMEGIYRLLRRIWILGLDVIARDTKENQINCHDDKKDWEDCLKQYEIKMNSKSYNSVIALLMKMQSIMSKNDELKNKECLLEFLECLAPFAPSLCMEIWSRIHN